MRTERIGHLKNFKGRHRESNPGPPVAQCLNQLRHRLLLDNNIYDYICDYIYDYIFITFMIIFMIIFETENAVSFQWNKNCLN